MKNLRDSKLGQTLSAVSLPFLPLQTGKLRSCRQKVQFPEREHFRQSQKRAVTTNVVQQPSSGRNFRECQTPATAQGRAQGEVTERRKRRRLILVCVQESACIMRLNIILSCRDMYFTGDLQYFPLSAGNVAQRSTQRGCVICDLSVGSDVQMIHLDFQPLFINLHPFCHICSNIKPIVGTCSQFLLL